MRFLLLACVLVACGDDSTATDSGTPDVGIDTGGRDASCDPLGPHIEGTVTLSSELATEVEAGDWQFLNLRLSGGGFASYTLAEVTFPLDYRVSSGLFVGIDDPEQTMIAWLSNSPSSREAGDPEMMLGPFEFSCTGNACGDGICWGPPLSGDVDFTLERTP